MKKKSLSPIVIQRLKNTGWLAAYLCLTVIIPFLKMKSYVYDPHCASHQLEKKVGMFAYLFLVSMILSFIPYKLSKFSSRTEKVIFITIGLVVPFLALCISILASKMMCLALGLQIFTLLLIKPKQKLRRLAEFQISKI